MMILDQTRRSLRQLFRTRDEEAISRVAHEYEDMAYFPKEEIKRGLWPLIFSDAGLFALHRLNDNEHVNFFVTAGASVLFLIGILSFTWCLTGFAHYAYHRAKLRVFNQEYLKFTDEINLTKEVS
jgi:hypothetical protein